LTQPSKLPVR